MPVVATLLWFVLSGFAWAHPRTVVPRQAALYRATVIREVRFYWGMAERPSTFLGQIHQESGFREDARSPVGAEGLSQIMPRTGAWLWEIYPADLREACPQMSGCPRDAKWAIRAVVLFDKRLYDSYRFAIGDDRWAWTLASYNGGSGNANKEKRLCPCDKNRWFGSVENFCLRTAANCRENRGYPRRILLELRHHYE